MDALESLRDELRPLFDAARAAWPGIDVPFETFAARVAAAGVRGSADGAAGATINGRELYLACACAAGDLAALREFEEGYLGAARAAIARIDRSPDFVAEVQQVLRERLLVGPDAKLADYRGSGSLAGWVRTAAVRTALNLLRSYKGQVDDDESLGQLEQRLSPELALMKEQHRRDINAAIQRALAELSSDDRLILRYYYVDGLTLAKVAGLQKVSLSTVYRRLEAATQTVLARVRTDLADRLRLSTESLDSLLRNIHDEIDLSLSQLLGARC
jgi:RNA polymerase sigma-70 factor (ECF subfamily)